MDSRYMPLMMVMTMPANNRAEVTQAVVTNMLNLGSTQRTMFAAMNANSTADNHRIAVERAERETGNEVIGFLADAIEKGTFDVPEETLAKYPRVSKYALNAGIKSRLQDIEFPGKVQSQDGTALQSRLESPVYEEVLKAFSVAYEKQSGSLNRDDRESVPILKAVFEGDPELERGFEKIVREVRKVAKAQSG